MGKHATVTVRIPPEADAKLETLARNTKRSKTDLAGPAIASFVEWNAAQVAQIQAALEDAKSGTPGIPHAEVERWVESWDTDHELPRPESKP